MLGNSLVVGSVGTFPLVNEGGYSSEYRFADSGVIYTLRVRHSKEKPQGNGVAMDRHNVELTATHPPSMEFPQGHVVQTYAIYRLPPSVDVGQIADLAVALQSLLHGAALDDNAVFDKVLNWES